ncbi:hypothetical protein KC353_g17647, partial [Hortaea werneckii]
MPGVVTQTSPQVPNKRALQEAPVSRRNQQMSPSKKRKLENDGTPKFKALKAN